LNAAVQIMAQIDPAVGPVNLDRTVTYECHDLGLRDLPPVETGNHRDPATVEGVLWHPYRSENSLPAL
jgi:hypothetical protein